MEQKSTSKLMLLVKSTIFIVLATAAIGASACGTCKYRCGYTTSYVTYKWVPGYYRNCCWVPAQRVAYVHYKKHYKTYYTNCVTYNRCNSCSNSFLFGWF